MSAATPAPPAPPAPASVCPKCRGPVSASDRFCPTCGAALAPPPPTGAPVDIRARVEEDRGALKKLQMLIPGFRGYRQGEDLREADSVLRLQIADTIHTSIGLLTDRRQTLATSGHYDGLTDLAQSIADLTRLEGEIRHAEQGYTGISPALRVNVSGQDKLYEYDYGFALAANDLQQAASALAQGSDSAAVANIRTLVNRLEQAFRARIRTIQQVAVP